jgi:hypothetical protein
MPWRVSGNRFSLRLIRKFHNFFRAMQVLHSTSRSDHSHFLTDNRQRGQRTRKTWVSSTFWPLKNLNIRQSRKKIL